MMNAEKRLNVDGKDKIDHAPEEAENLSDPGWNQLARWMLNVTKPVLSALRISVLARILDQLLGVALFGWGGARVTMMVFRLINGVTVPNSYIWITIAVMAILAILKGFLHYLEQFAGHFVAFKALELLRREMFIKLTPQAPGGLASFKSGDLLARITTDIDRIEVFFAHTIAPAISAVVVPTLVAIFVGAYTSPLAGIGVLFCYVFTIAVLCIVGRGEASKANQETLKAKGQVAQSLTDSVYGVSETVGYGLQKVRRIQLERYQSQAGAYSRVVGATMAFRRAWTQAMQLLTLVVLVLATMPGLWGTDTVGLSEDVQVHACKIVICFLMVLRSWEVIRGVEDFSTAVGNSFASALRVWQIAHAKPPVQDGGEELIAASAQELGDIAWKELTFSYPSTAERKVAGPALTDINLKVKAGSWTALVGLTGAGKSTLISLLERYWDPDRGRVEIGGRDIRDFTLGSLRSQIAVVTQRIYIFRGTVAENLRLIKPSASEEELWSVLETAGLASEIKALPKGLDQMIGERGSTLSGGQRQRLSFARALLGEAPVIVLDEFTAHLDPALAKKLRTNLRMVRPDATVLEVTHTLGQIRQADKVAVLEGGRVIEQGAPAQLLAREYSRLTALVEREL